MTKVLMRAYCRTPGKKELSMWETDPVNLVHEGQIDMLINSAEMEAENAFGTAFKRPVLISIQTLSQPAVEPVTHRTDPSRA